MITYTVDNVKTHVTCSKFPDGTVQANINVGSKEPDPNVHKIIQFNVQFGEHFTDRGAKLYTNDILAALDQAVEAVKIHFAPCSLLLKMAYVPYARQDRSFTAGDAVGARFLAKTINGMGFDSVSILDPHSDVVAGLLNNVHVTSSFEVMRNAYREWGDKWIVAPDLGASKKALAFSDAIGAKGVIQCMKVREGSTVKTYIVNAYQLEGTKVDHAVIVDDICDGGATFIATANALEGFADIKNLDLVVTHGIFSAGFDKLLENFYRIYTTNSYKSADSHEHVTVLNII